MQNVTWAHIGTKGLSLENINTQKEWFEMAKTNQRAIQRVCQS